MRDVIVKIFLPRSPARPEACSIVLNVEPAFDLFQRLVMPDDKEYYYPHQFLVPNVKELYYQLQF
jgi:hypothetical protein